jgi:hypothetical protein
MIGLMGRTSKQNFEQHTVRDRFLGASGEVD